MTDDINQPLEEDDDYPDYYDYDDTMSCGCCSCCGCDCWMYDDYLDDWSDEYDAEMEDDK